MLHNFTKRRWLVVLLAVLGVGALSLVGRWLNATKIGGQQPAEPFRIAGNFYYVGANDVAAFLITGPLRQRFQERLCASGSLRLF
jgi:hypothetical protein